MTIVASFCMLTAVPAFSDDKPMTLKQYNKAYRALLKQYQDNPISKTIAAAQENSDQFVDGLIAQHADKPEAADWYARTNVALRFAKEHDWSNATKQLEIAQAMHKTSMGSDLKLADVCLLNALFKKSAQRYQESLNDLRALYELHKNEPTAWNADSWIFAESRTNYEGRGEEHRNEKWR
jgi:hypothetical protein